MEARRAADPLNLLIPARTEHLDSGYNKVAIIMLLPPPLYCARDLFAQTICVPFATRQAVPLADTLGWPERSLIMETWVEALATSPATLLCIGGLTLALIYLVGLSVWRLYLCPQAAIPGPTFAKLTFW
jgi:hypothetical protein